MIKKKLQRATFSTVSTLIVIVFGMGSRLINSSYYRVVMVKLRSQAARSADLRGPSGRQGETPAPCYVAALIY